MLSVVLVSNFYHHHQSSFSEAMNEMDNIRFCFIETSPMTEERKKMGYEIKNKPSYVVSAFDSPTSLAQCKRIIDEADLAIFGDARDSFIRFRHKNGKIVFRYSERFYKTGCRRIEIPLRKIKNYFRFNRYKNDYLLCASAYTAADAAITKSFVGKAYKWGYFPPVRRTDLDDLMSKKNTSGVISLLWGRRLLDWKHPEVAVFLAEKLHHENLNFELTIIGGGELENTLRNLISQKRLESCVNYVGLKKPYEVREYMEKSNVFLFTSDYQEGWGAVLNEAMNSGCAVVASHAIGSVPYLLKNGINGFVYENGDNDSLLELVRDLILDSNMREKVGRAAYNCIINDWNGEVAAQRLISLYWDLKEKGSSNRYSDGICSHAELLENDWYKNE